MLGPIFTRETLTIPRRGRHYFVRSAYLLVLWVLALTAWQAAFGFGREYSLGDLAHFGALVFRLLGHLQLVLVIFFSALFAAGAISHEKDRRTFTLLLLTDLTNFEIVVGKLFGSLLGIGALVICAVPLLAFTVLLGGVSFPQVLLALLVLLSSALAAGSLGGLLALWREKTYQTLALTVLLLVLYIVGIEGLGLVPGLGNWPTWLNPFRALQNVAQPSGDEAAGMMPAFQFAAAMVLLTAALNTVGVWKLRVWNPSGEPIQHRETADDEAADRPRSVHAAPGRLRDVSGSPVLWREVRTRAYGRRPLLIKAAYLLVFALICFAVYRGLPRSGMSADRLLPALGLVPVAVISLLLVNAQAVTAITSERDGKMLDLLFVTDITAKEFIFGKLGGILYNSKEIILPPLLLAIAYAAMGFIGFENFLYVFIALVTLTGFAAVLGVYVGLLNANSRRAIGSSLGTVFFLFVGALVCTYLIVISGSFEYQWFSFIGFIAAGILGLWWVLGWNRSSMAISIAAWLCPLGIFYAITNIVVGNPYTGAAGDPLWPFMVLTFAFGFTVAAMLVPLLSEFDVALGHTAATADE